MIRLNRNDFYLFRSHTLRQFPSSGSFVKLVILDIFCNELHFVHLLIQHSHGWQSPTIEGFNRTNLSHGSINVVSKISVLIHSLMEENIHDFWLWQNQRCSNLLPSFEQMTFDCFDLFFFLLTFDFFLFVESLLLHIAQSLIWCVWICFYYF